MKRIWNKIQNLNISVHSKNKLFIFLEMVEYAVLGSLVWAIVGRIYLPDWTWLACFIGYPCMFIGLMGSVLYLFNHEFGN